MARRANKPAGPPGVDVPRLLAAVGSEARPYTDPRAGYDRARDARQARTEGTFRRGRH